MTYMHLSDDSDKHYKVIFPISLNILKKTPFLNQIIPTNISFLKLVSKINQRTPSYLSNTQCCRTQPLSSPAMIFIILYCLMKEMIDLLDLLIELTSRFSSLSYIVIIWWWSHHLKFKYQSKNIWEERIS